MLDAVNIDAVECNGQGALLRFLPAPLAPPRMWKLHAQLLSFQTARSQRPFHATPGDAVEVDSLLRVLRGDDMQAMGAGRACYVVLS